MHILSALTILADVETKMSGLYAWLAELFAGDAEASGLFFRMSLQERSHYNLVRFGQRLVRTGPAEFSAVAVNLADVEELLTNIAQFRANTNQPSLAESLRFAAGAERHMCENVHRTVIMDSNPGVARLISSLAASDADHLRALDEFVREPLGEGAEP